MHQGATFNAKLYQLGFYNKADLLARRIKLADQKPKCINNHTAVRCILVFSRLSLGAEVAINTVIVRKLIETFPRAEIVLVEKIEMSNLFWGIPHFRVPQHHHAQCGCLRVWFDSWLALYDLVQKEKSDLTSDQFLLIDPDSRLTQLGFLPLNVPDSTLYSKVVHIRV